MAGRGVQATILGLLLYFTHLVHTYKISTVDTSGVCNETIWLEEGPKSAAILRLTAKDFYDFTPLRCLITFKAPQHRWSGLTGVLEEVDLRRYVDTTGHHLAQNECLDYIKVVSETGTGVPQERQCGSWSVSGTQRLTHLGFRRALVGYCPTPPATGQSVLRCGMSELTVEVSVGQRDNHYLWRDTQWGPHRGFTFVVTAYRYSYRESECATGLRSCGTTDRHGLQHHCVHQSLWCDHHINCGQPHNFDEISCHDEEMLGGLVTVMVGPWVGAALLLLLVLAGVVYWRRARPPVPGRGDHPPPQELNSYAESYEVSSTLSSAHHMAIQVRVVCNSGHGPHSSQRALPWPGADLPPSYDSLFPQGPPSPKFSTSTSTNSASTSFDITTTSLVSLVSNTSASPAPSAFFSNTTQTSSIVIPISAICSSHSTSSVSTTTTTNTTPPVFTTTTTTAACGATTSTSSSLCPNTQTYANSPSPTTTITVASLGPSLSTRATISVVPNTPDEASGSASSLCDAKAVSRLTPARISDYSNRGGRPSTPTNLFEIGSHDPTTSTPAAPGPPPPNITPPLVEPEDTEITPDDATQDTLAGKGLCLGSGGAENEATSSCGTLDTAHTQPGELASATPPPGGVDEDSHDEEEEEEAGTPARVRQEALAHSGRFQDVAPSPSISLDTGQAGTTSATGAEGNTRPLIDAWEKVLMSPTNTSITTAAASRLRGGSCASTAATVRDKAVPDKLRSRAGTSITTSSETAVANASQLSLQEEAVVDPPHITREPE